jgi:2,3-bisphosphoglycerate-dependent phosphoglycerate mutase
MRSFQKTKKIYKVVFVRHGESIWNKSNQFSGWVDVPLNQNGIKEARDAGIRLKQNGYSFDLAYTSMLKRSIVTYHHIADELDLDWIPSIKHWRLNERHYGELQGLNKKETAKIYGED